MSTCSTIISRHIDYLRDNFLCESRGDHYVLTTPYTFPDNDAIQVFIRETADGRVVVSDRGEALRHVAVMSGHHIAESQAEMLNRIAAKHDLIFQQGEFIALTSYAESGEAILRLSMAIKEVGDLAAVARVQSVVRFAHRVRGLFEQRRIPYEADFPVVNEDGLNLSVDFFVPAEGGKFIQAVGQQAGKKDALETYHIFNELLERDDHRQKFVLVEKTLSKPNMLMLRRKADRVFTWAEADELTHALGA